MKKTLIFLVPVYAAIIVVVALYGIKKYEQLKSFDSNYSHFEEITQSAEDTAHEGKPVKLFLPSIKLTLNIEEGNYTDTTKSWNVSATNAHWASVTKPANDIEGNTLIYGHNTNKVLGLTRNLKTGDKLLLVTDNDLIFEYQLSGSKEVSPLVVDIFECQGEPVVTLVTCSGIADSKRKLMNFEFVKVL